MKDTNIEWCDSTFKPWWGCTKVSPACDNCYAAALDKRTGGNHWGTGVERRRTSPANWAQPIKWDKQAAVDQIAWEKLKKDGATDEWLIERGFKKPTRPRVFCASMADVFDNEVDPQWRADLFYLIAVTPHLDWLLLTKRIGNASRMIADASAVAEFEDGGTPEWTSSTPWPNVWLGATICNQEEADRDIPKLLAVPAAKRFLSIEPMLGAIDLTRMIVAENGTVYEGAICHKRIDWVIVGGESGPSARPMHPNWARSLRDQCKAAGIPFFFKQWGDFAPSLIQDGGRTCDHIPIAGMTDFTPQISRKFTHDWNDGTALGAVRLSKKAAGRLLDGADHNGVPA